jgi:hypothetical protein
VTGTVREAERDAEKLLEGWWTTPDQSQPLPVDPLAMAGGLGIRVEEVQLPPDVSGSIDIPERGIAVISLNRQDSKNRRRFTCAHEIGHYLRREASAHYGRSFTDYRDTLAGLGVDAEEIYANQFAAALLMPAHLVSKWCKTEAVDTLAHRFGTSAQAMQLRLRNLRLA